MIARRTFALAAAFALLAIPLAIRAEDKKPDYTGTWKWKTAGRQGGEEREFTLKLKQEGEKVTGKLLGYGTQEIEIKEGKIKDGALSFNIVRAGRDGGQERTTKYTGKLEGETIKGKTETGTADNPRSRDWEAKKAKEEKAA